MKQCPNCTAFKGARQFRKNGAICRSCRASTVRWRQANREHCNAYARKYRQTHPKIRAYQKRYLQQYYQKHKAHWNRPKYAFTCQWCGKQSTATRPNCKYCSPACMGKSYKCSGETNYKHAGKTWEHRMVMAKMLGRSLRQGEVVHHINGNRSDNSQKNLVKFPSSGAHMKHHWQLTQQRLKERSHHHPV